MEDNERLIDAVSNWRVKEFEDFLAGGADVNTTDFKGDSLLLLAAAEGDVDMVKLLLERGADPLRVGSKGCTVWHWLPFGCSLGCSLEIARLLLPLNPHIDTKADNGATPLWYALMDDCMEVAEFLLVRGADPNSSNGHGWTGLHEMASDGNEQGVRLLLKYGARIDISDKRGDLPCQCVPDDKPDLLLALVPEDW